MTSRTVPDLMKKSFKALEKSISHRCGVTGNPTHLPKELFEMLVPCDIAFISEHFTFYFIPISYLGAEIHPENAKDSKNWKKKIWLQSGVSKLCSMQLWPGFPRRIVQHSKRRYSWRSLVQKINETPETARLNGHNNGRPWLFKIKQHICFAVSGSPSKKIKWLVQDSKRVHKNVASTVTNHSTFIASRTT